MGVRDDGKPDRRHVRGKTKARVAEKVRKLEQQRDRGEVRKAGERWRLSDWLMHWIDNIAVSPPLSPNTHDGYRNDVEVHLIPGVGAHWLDGPPRLEPEHLERLYEKMMASGSSPGTANHVHRTVRVALNVAVRQGKLTRNPAKLAKAPTSDADEVDPYEVDEIQRLLEEASKGRNSARWAVALALGLRQGEALGLKREDLDLKRQMLFIRRNRLRPKYRHGCGSAHPCGRKPGFCPDRVQTNPDTRRVKSRAGKRTMGVPPPLIPILERHLADQAAERATARDLWNDEGWLFATRTGELINPNTDYHEWKRLLKAAGLREARLHDARHTAATVLLILGQPDRTVMSLMGWSSSSMTKRYQHVTDTVRADVAARVGQLIWQTEEGSGPLADGVTVRRSSLATILPLVERGVLDFDNGADVSVADIESALADLRSALSGATNNSEGGTE